MFIGLRPNLTRFIPFFLKIYPCSRAHITGTLYFFGCTCLLIGKSSFLSYLEHRVLELIFRFLPPRGQFQHVLDLFRSHVHIAFVLNVCLKYFLK